MTDRIAYAAIPVTTAALALGAPSSAVMHRSADGQWLVVKVPGRCSTCGLARGSGIRGHSIV